MHRLLYVAVAVVFMSVSASSQGPTGFNKDGVFWGTWVHQVSMGPGLNAPALVTLHVDGTVVGAGGFMFGGLPGATSKSGPLHGVWVRTGQKSIGATTLLFLYDASTGVLTGYRRHRCSLTFSEDFNRYAGTEFMETVSCVSPLGCPDPLDPATGWTPLSNMPPSGFSVSGTRVERIPAGPLNP